MSTEVKDTTQGSGANPGGKCVLIVEDNELNMKLFHDLLEAHGYATLQTKDGMEALKLAREHRPDLILMDIQLPEVSGLEVTKWIKEDEPDHRGHRLCHEGRRRKDTGRRLRGLSGQADFRYQVPSGCPAFSEHLTISFRGMES